MSYAEALERLKKVEHGPGTAVPEVTKGTCGTSVTPEPRPFENFKASGSEVSCHQKALSKAPLPNAEISGRPAPRSAKSDRTMPSREELARICRRATADYPSVEPERLRRFLEIAQDPEWTTERAARHLARRISEGLIRLEDER